MGAGTEALIVCESCGKKYKWLPQLIGKQVKCICGTPIRVDASPVLPNDPVPVLRSAPSRPAQAAVSKELLDRLGVQPARRRLEDQDKEVIKQQRKELDEMAEGSFARDVIAPIPIILLGIILIVIEEMHFTKGAPHTLADTLPGIIFRVILGVGLVIGAMFLAMMLMDVRFIGSMKNCLLRFAAIALGPGALYGMISMSVGDIAGSSLGVLVSLVAYTVLIWALMRLDLKDTSICVLLTWILVTFANYVAYKVQGVRGNSWI